MRKNNNKQKKSLVLSTALVITGCIATAVYVNQSMNVTSDYKLDLTQMNTGEETGNSLANDPELNEGASLARVSGRDVVNTYPKEKPSQPEEKKISEEKPSGEVEQQEESMQDEKLEESVETSSKSVVTPLADLSFSEEDGMGWPLVGDVILNYSMDSAVYFATLMQYKYNPAVFIGAKQGDNVSSVARGQVVKIGQSAQLGQYVVMNVGSGYEVTYGQLESLQVQEGSIVSRGQVIGNVAKTTKYYSVEGDHVYLMITKDGNPVDPLSLLQ